MSLTFRPFAEGNLAARLRSVILFDQSAKLGALPLGTGNKSERLLGYYTWHADDSPPINPLGDLFKTQVWDLARQPWGARRDHRQARVSRLGSRRA